MPTRLSSSWSVLRGLSASVPVPARPTEMTSVLLKDEVDEMPVSIGISVCTITVLHSRSRR